MPDQIEDWERFQFGEIEVFVESFGHSRFGVIVGTRRLGEVFSGILTASGDDFPEAGTHRKVLEEVAMKAVVDIRKEGLRRSRARDPGLEAMRQAAQILGRAMLNDAYSEVMNRWRDQKRHPKDWTPTGR